MKERLMNKHNLFISLFILISTFQSFIMQAGYSCCKYTCEYKDQNIANDRERDASSCVSCMCGMCAIGGCLMLFITGAPTCNPAPLAAGGGFGVLGAACLSASACQCAKNRKCVKIAPPAPDNAVPGRILRRFSRRINARSGAGIGFEEGGAVILPQPPRQAVMNIIPQPIQPHQLQ